MNKPLPTDIEEPAYRAMPVIQVAKTRHPGSGNTPDHRAKKKALRKRALRILRKRRR